MKYVACSILLLASACGDSGVEPAPTGSRHITQGGAQDIALFRSIVARGQVPAPETLDDVGFFAEYATDLPPADCGEDVCLHPMLAVAPRFDGGNWTMAFVGLNSPVDPASVERPPMHVVVALEKSAYTRAVDSWAEAGVRSLAAQLRPEDRISLVAFDFEAALVLHGARPGEIGSALPIVRSSFGPRARVALYDGLARAAEATELEGFDGETRILLVSSGHASMGISSPERILGLAEALVEQQIGISVIGAGDFVNGLVADIGDLGAGRYAYAEDGADLEQLLATEAELSLIPLATHFELEVVASPGYRVGRIYGARRAAALDDRAWLSSPALFLGRHADATPGEGRRGGGGGLFVELIADASADVAPGAAAFTLNASWTSADGLTTGTVRPVMNALAPGQNPDDMWPEFTTPEHGNVFMMLNMYLALKTAVDFYDAGDCARSLGVIDLMAPSVEGWQVRNGNPEIWADFDLLLDLRDNAEAACTETPVPPSFFEGSCFML